VTTLEMSCQQVSEPALQQWHDTTQEEQPHSPARSPESTTWSFSDWSCVEAVVDNVLQILTLFMCKLNYKRVNVRSETLQADAQ
jgi:hypothetical protein